MIISSLFSSPDLMLINTRSVFIESPQFPGNYPNNVYKFWSINAPIDYVIKVEFTQLQIERRADFIYVGDGVNEFSRTSHKWLHLTGHLRDIWDNRRLTSNSSTIIIIFTSDGSGTNFGFRIECSAYKTKPESTKLPEENGE